jgi:ABC-2 type transport system permease protein
VLASNFTGAVGEFFSMLSLSVHFESISRGVVDSKDIFYFLSIVFLGLILAENSLAKRKISG